MSNATLKRTMALVPIADLDDMADTLCDYVDLLEGRSHGDTQAVDDMRGVELLIAKLRGHIAGETLIGATTS